MHPANLPSLLASPVSRRRVAIGCLLLAVLGVAACLILSAPAALAEAQAAVPGGALAGGAAAGPATLQHAVAVAAALLALLAGGLGVTATAPAETRPGLLPALQQVVEDLRGVAAEHRMELAALRNSHGHVTEVSAQLASAALEAEARLAAGVTEARQALGQPRDIPDQAEVALRIDRTLAELKDLVRSSLDRPPATADRGEQALDAAAAVTETAERAVQMLADATAALRSDGDALKTAGREIAAAAGILRHEAETLQTAAERAAGNIVACAGDTAAAVARDFSAVIAAWHGETGDLAATMHRIDAVAHAAVAAFDAASAQAVQASAALTEAAETLRAEGEGFDAACRSGGLTTQADNETSAVRATAQLAAACDAANQTISALAGLPDLAASLYAAAAALVRDSAALGAVGRQVAAAGSSVAERLAADAAAREAVQRALPEATAALAAAAASIQDRVAALDDAARHPTAAGGEAATISASPSPAADADAAILRLQQHGEALQVTAETALRRIAVAAEDAASMLDEAGQKIMAAGRDMADQFATDAARTEAALLGLPEVTGSLTVAAGALRTEAAVLADLTRELACAGSDAATAMGKASGQAVAVLVEATSGLRAEADGLRAEDSAVRADRKGLLSAGREIAKAICSLRDEAACLAAAAARMATAGDATADGQAVDAGRHAAMLHDAATMLDRLEALGPPLEQAVAQLLATVGALTAPQPAAQATASARQDGASTGPDAACAKVQTACVARCAEP